MPGLNIPDELKGCLRTEVVSSDGERMVLFHDQEMTLDEIGAFSIYTLEEITLILSKMGFESHSMGSC